jgi:hypothetical protein
MQEHCVSTSETQECSGNGLLSIDWNLDIHNCIQPKSRTPWMIGLILSRSCLDRRYNDSNRQS